jgi:hypothetical protein
MAKSSKGRVARPVLDGDAERAVTSAIHGLYRIRRLAIRAVDELSADGGDAESFCMAITEISQLHGKALDDCVKRVTGAPGVGCFDTE